MFLEGTEDGTYILVFLEGRMEENNHGYAFILRQLSYSDLALISDAWFYASSAA